MRTIKEFDSKNYESLLKGVIDSRLLFSTKEYIAKHIGIKSLQNQAIRKAIPNKFLQKSIFEGLSNEVAFMCDNQIDLATFINKYKEASDFYHQRVKNLSYFKNKSDGSYNPHIFDLIDMVYVKNDIEEALPKKVKECIESMYDVESDTLKIDVPLIIMLILKVLPTYNEGGDFGSSHESNANLYEKTIEKDYCTMNNFLKEYFQHSDFPSICSLDILERIIIEDPKIKEGITNYDNIPSMNRISLYWHTAIILTDIDTYLHSDKCKKRTEEYQQTQLFPNISGLWCQEESGLSTSYWKIKQINWGYEVELCKLTNKEIEFDTAELYLYDYNSNFYDNNLIRKRKENGEFRTQLYYCSMSSSRCIRSFLDEKYTNDQEDTDYFICYINFNSKKAKCIEIFPINPNNKLRYCTLYSIRENSKIANIDRECQIRVNTGFKYKCRRSLVAITQEHLYLGYLTKEEICSDEEYLEDKKYDKYYKIPKILNETFWDFRISSNIGIVVSTFEDGDRYYIAAPDSLDYYDITTVEKMKTLGIELVDKIDQD